MSNIVDTSFGDDYAIFDIKSPTDAHPKAMLGCNGGYALACQSTGLGKALPGYTWKSPLTTATARVQAAVFKRTIFASKALIHLADAQTVTPPDTVALCTASVDIILSILDDGSLQFTCSRGSGFTAYTAISALGIFPLDGTYQGVQVTLDFTSTSALNYEVFLNNVSVLSGTVTTGNASLFWGNPFDGCDNSNVGLFAGINYAALAGVDIAAVKVSVANLQVDDTVNVLDYTGCSQLTPVNVAGCNLTPNPNGPGGIYILVPGKTHDTIYSDTFVEVTENVKIPDLFAETYFVGDEP